jgi:hypothetical protein
MTFCISSVRPKLKWHMCCHVSLALQYPTGTSPDGDMYKVYFWMFPKDPKRLYYATLLAKVPSLSSDDYVFIMSAYLPILLILISCLFS